MAFDTFDGWPIDGALTDNVKPKDGEEIIAGMAVKKDATGELVKADASAGERVFWAVQDQDDADVEAAGKMPTILTNAVILTDQFEAGAYAGNAKLEVSGTTPGVVAELGGGTEIDGVFTDGKITRDGIEYLKVVIK